MRSTGRKPACPYLAVSRRRDHRRRGHPLLPAQRRRHLRPGPRLRRQPHAGGVAQGALHPHDAVRAHGAARRRRPPPRRCSTPPSRRNARKLREVRLAMSWRSASPSRHILERYLNIGLLRPPRLRRLRRLQGLLLEGAQGPDAWPRRPCSPGWSRRPPTTTRPSHDSTRGQGPPRLGARARWPSRGSSARRTRPRPSSEPVGSTSTSRRTTARRGARGQQLRATSATSSRAGGCSRTSSAPTRSERLD